MATHFYHWSFSDALQNLHWPPVIGSLSSSKPNNYLSDYKLQPCNLAYLLSDRKKLLIFSQHDNKIPIFDSLTQKQTIMEFNLLAILVAALSSFVVGFIWYNPKVFGNIWMRESGMTAGKMKGTNMVILLGLSFFYAFLNYPINICSNFALSLYSYKNGKTKENNSL